MSENPSATGKGISTPSDDDVTAAGRGPGSPDDGSRQSGGSTTDDGSVGTDGRGPG